jgi:hypothetical protein
MVKGNFGLLLSKRLKTFDGEVFTKKVCYVQVAMVLET